MGDRDYYTTSIYADYAPDPLGGIRFAAAAFGNTMAPEPTHSPYLSDGETANAAGQVNPGSSIQDRP